MGEVEAGEDDDGSGRVTLTPFERWTHDMGSQALRLSGYLTTFQFLTYLRYAIIFLFLGLFTH